MSDNMTLTLNIWRQKDRNSPGKLVPYKVEGVSHHMSFLEMLDWLNQDLIKKGEEPVTFEHDCREGICGACGMVINGTPHAPNKGTTACQLHMRFYKDGDTITIEPWRSRAFPVLKDLLVDRSAFDRIIQAGGFVSVRTGSASEANGILVAKENAELAMDAAECIGCGACVAACPNGSANLFIAAKVAQFAMLPQGQPERYERVRRMFEQAQKEGFGYCSNYAECEAVCPKRISINFIAAANADFHKAMFSRREGKGGKAV